jgi:hypothetical protein
MDRWSKRYPRPTLCGQQQLMLSKKSGDEPFCPFDLYPINTFYQAQKRKIRRPMPEGNWQYSSRDALVYYEWIKERE